MISVTETRQQHWNRNYDDLLQELRVVQTGNQILFAFLLAAVFAPGFADIDDFQRTVYVITLITTVAATALIIAPVGLHRMVFRRGAKPSIVRIASRLAVAGLTLVLVSICGALFLAIDVAVGRTAAVAVTSVAVVVHIVLWFVIPLTQRARHDSIDE